jgi:hypothetical protein
MEVPLLSWTKASVDSRISESGPYDSMKKLRCRLKLVADSRSQETSQIVL